MIFRIVDASSSHWNVKTYARSSTHAREDIIVWLGFRDHEMLAKQSAMYTTKSVAPGTVFDERRSAVFRAARIARSPCGMSAAASAKRRLEEANQLRDTMDRLSEAVNANVGRRNQAIASTATRGDRAMAVIAGIRYSVTELARFYQFSKGRAGYCRSVLTRDRAQLRQVLSSRVPTVRFLLGSPLPPTCFEFRL